MLYNWRMPSKIDSTDILGNRYGQLVVVSEAEKRGGMYHYLCKCDCGNEKVIQRYSLTQGKTISCGCFHKKMVGSRYKSHGMSGSSTYEVWCGMKKRCYRKSSISYSNYGGRGIYICDRWRNSFQNFLDDMGEKPDGKSIERIDNDGPYSPENCIWADRKTQSRNRRANRVIRFKGQEMCLSDWARTLGMPMSALSRRINHLGWDTEKALTTPIKKSLHSKANLHQKSTDYLERPRSRPGG